MRRGNDVVARLIEAAQRRAREGLARRLREITQGHTTHVVLDGRRLLNFSSNDYLGLAGHPDLVAALKDAADRHGVGATAASLVCGHRRPHSELEQALAEWTGRERALLFGTGYAANLGVLQALLDAGDSCVQDRLNHASLIDGARLAGCSLRRYPHADTEAARRQLALDERGGALLVTDGVFSMDGDVAPLAALAACAHDMDAAMMVDDAHGLGVLGPEGAGSVAEAGLDAKQVPVLMATLGKALGTAGAFVAGNADFIAALAQFARSHVYSTAPPPALAAATLAAVGIARREQWRRDHLAALVDHFQRGARALDLPVMPSRTPIQPLLLGSAEQVVAVSAALEQAGFLVVAIRPPTVPVGRSRLRITFTAQHSLDDVDALLRALAAAMRDNIGSGVGSDVGSPVQLPRS